MKGFENILPEIKYIVTKGNLVQNERGYWSGVREGDFIELEGRSLLINKGNAGTQIGYGSQSTLDGVDYEVHFDFHKDQVKHIEIHLKEEQDKLNTILTGKCPLACSNNGTCKINKTTCKYCYTDDGICFCELEGL